MYQDLKVVLKIGKIEEKMSQTVGVRQVDCMAPVLFLFMVIVFTETLETEWSKADLKMISLRQQAHSPRDVGKLTGHKKKNFEQGTHLALFCVLYVDDNAFTFEYRDQLTRGLNLIYQHFTRFGLEMHIGKGKKIPKPNVSSSLHQDFSDGNLTFQLKKKRRRKMLGTNTRQESHESR